MCVLNKSYNLIFYKRKMLMFPQYKPWRQMEKDIHKFVEGYSKVSYKVRHKSVS